ncbi:alpha/beta hydrolase [Roseivivax isoporae]|nr:alpha/beta hydrolase [Roseivivax isoporae]
MPENDRVVAREGVKIEERVVPVPSSISPEAQARLKAAVGPDGTPLNAIYTVPAPGDHEVWRSMREAADAQYAAAMKDRAVCDTAEVETIRIGDATVHVATPSDVAFSGCVYIDLHGGAFVFGGGEACRESARNQAAAHGLLCYGVDYRMPPDHPFPAALDDCLAVYESVAGRFGADRVVIGGRSAGGNLALATVLRAHDEGMTPPAGLVLLSPEADLTESGDSFQVNRTVDVVLPNPLMSANLLYANGADLAHRYLSPLFGEVFDGFPPTFIQSGTRDLFLSNAVRLHRAMRRRDVDADLHVFEAMPHGGFGGCPEDGELLTEVAGFIRKTLRGA